MNCMILTKGAQLSLLMYQFNTAFQHILLDDTVSKELFSFEDEQER